MLRIMPSVAIEPKWCHVAPIFRAGSASRSVSVMGSGTDDGMTIRLPSSVPKFSFNHPICSVLYAITFTPNVSITLKNY